MPAPLLDRLEEVANGAPARTGLVQGERRVSYGEILAGVRRAAADLTGCTDPGDRVALLVENSPEYVQACYGTWAAGAALVALNPAIRGEEVVALLAHSGARCLLATPDYEELAWVGRALGDAVEVIEVPPGRWSEPGAHAPHARVQAAAAPRPRARLGDLAALVYTSGTTGDPKGVMISHANLAANTDSIGPGERAACVLPFHYSYGASVLHTHLTRGASILLENSLMYPGPVLERMVSERVTSLAGVPSTFYVLLGRADLRRYDLSSIRYVTQAGGRMDEARIQEFRAVLPGADFIVMYGQTEATARLTWLPAPDLGRKPGSAGRAIPGVEVVVRGQDGRELPTGVVGEVCARGDNVMMGYWNDAEGTARTLRDGWLHTGDLGYLDDEGYLFLTGRTWEMIKSGAYRIAPAEIEALIREVPGVQDVAVVGVEDPYLGEAVKACVVATDVPDRALQQRIQRTCREKLARFKVPKVVQFYDTLPRTSSGKVRKHLL